MKKIFIFLAVCVSCTILVLAQTPDETVSIETYDNESCDSLSVIQKTIDACASFANAAANEDISAMKAAKKDMLDCNMVYYEDLKEVDCRDSISLNGHLVFNECFADSLIAGKNAYLESDRINRLTKDRGQLKNGDILTKTCFVKAKGKAKFTFKSTGYQELAIVAEPHGLVSMRVHVVNKAKKINRWYNDTKDVAKGRNIRKTSFRLPAKPCSLVTLEVTNCSNRNISFVVISN